MIGYYVNVYECVYFDVDCVVEIFGEDVEVLWQCYCIDFFLVYGGVVGLFGLNNNGLLFLECFC